DRLAAEWGEALVPGEGRRGAFVVLGMGKLGGEELNYSSDVDLVYVYERDGEQAAGRTLGQFFSRLAEEVTRALGEVTGDGLVFRVDLRLRPGGGEGPVAVSLPAALSYYEAWGQTWERAAWLKARAVGGDRALGERLIAELMPFVYRRYLDFGTLEDLEAMKRRVDASLRGPQAARDVKLGRGGIREVEFFVQAQQLVHGGKDPRLQVRSTLGALAALAATGYVEPERALWRLGRLGFRDLESAYRELRLLRDGPPHAPASARRRAALVRLAPALLTEISRSAAPERALHHLATFVSTIGARTSYLHLLLENPGVMRLLVRLFATSEFLSAFFLRHPEVLDSLVRADLMRIVRARADLAAELAARLAAAPDLESRLDTL